jgi:hypothetical protein
MHTRIPAPPPASRARRAAHCPAHFPQMRPAHSPYIHEYCIWRKCPKLSAQLKTPAVANHNSSNYSEYRYVGFLPSSCKKRHLCKIALSSIHLQDCPLVDSFARLSSRRFICNIVLSSIHLQDCPSSKHSFVENACPEI